CEHKEWAPTRKVDAVDVDGDDMRNLVNHVLKARDPETPAPAPSPDPPADVDWAAVRRLTAGYLLPSVQDLPDLDGNSRGLRVIVLQRALNLVTGTKLTEDGIYGPATIQAVLNFQNFVKNRISGEIKDFPGAAHSYTRFYLIEALKQIKAGTA
ncbi:MAG: peptidoglycan-binding domain-containing protein, partial [bacterium]